MVQVHSLKVIRGRRGFLNFVRLGAALFTVLLSLTVFAKKHEVYSLDKVLPYVDSQTLVVFDIDNTLAESRETIGTVQWQEYEVEKGIHEGLDAKQALERSIRKFIAVNMVTELRPVEAQNTADTVEQMQSRAAGVMALTARPAELHVRTNYLLEKVGISLERKQPLTGSAKFIGKEQAVYANGILAVSPHNDKGEMLRWIISQPGFVQFSKIVFVDDKQKYVDSIEKALDGTRYEHNSFRYGAADERVRNFDPVLANKQTDHFEKFGEILSDKCL